MQRDLAEFKEPIPHPGDQVRREVLGDDYVDRARDASDAFTADLQTFLTDNCWGFVWTRPGLARKERSIATLSALAATGRWSEFGTHIRGALRIGCSVDEIRELLLHLGVYLGVPVAVEAFRTAQPIVHDFLTHEAAERNAENE